MLLSKINKVSEEIYQKGSFITALYSEDKELANKTICESVRSTLEELKKTNPIDSIPNAKKKVINALEFLNEKYKDVKSFEDLSKKYESLFFLISQMNMDLGALYSLKNIIEKKNDEESKIFLEKSYAIFNKMYSCLDEPIVLD